MLDCRLLLTSKFLSADKPLAVRIRSKTGGPGECAPNRESHGQTVRVGRSGITMHYHALPCTTMHFHALQTCQPWPGKNLGNLKLPVAKTWRLVSRTWRSRPTMSSIIVLCICNIHYQARSQSFVKGGSKIKGGAKRRRKLLLIDIHEGIRIRIWMWSMITS